MEEWTKSGEAHQRQVCEKLDEREAQVFMFVRVSVRVGERRHGALGADGVHA